MGRPLGSRSPDFEAKREALAERIMGHLIVAGAAGVSLRELAQACEVTPPTLRHYFGDLDGALIAAFELAKRAGAEHIAYTATAEYPDVRSALLGVLNYLLLRWREGVGRLNAIGLASGLARERVGPAYVNEILEPTLHGFEARIARHVALGELAVPDLRMAALQLVGPLLLALLHQTELGGADSRPLDVERLVELQVDAFLAAYAVCK